MQLSSVAFAPSTPILARGPRIVLRCSTSTSKIRPPRPASARTRVAPSMAGGGNQRGVWQGEWICVDCGYIYKPTRKVKFENLPNNWKCPQCAAPKRRFAKKAGDYVAETAGTSNLPIVIFSIVGLLATVAFGIWASTAL